MRKSMPFAFFLVFAFVLISIPSHYASASAGKNALEASPSYSSAALLPGVTVDVDVLVTIKAPVMAAKEKRPPVAVSLVIDRSGSMDEAKKIDYARRAAKTLVRSLEADDLFALTIYDDTVDVLFPLGPIKDKEKILQMIDRIEPRGWTFLSSGLEMGIKQLENVKREGPCRVILLSDGLANKGVTQGEKVAAIGAKARDRGIGVSAIGLGLDFDEDLMQQLAQRGGGQYYYIANSESLPSVFRDELNLVVNSFTKDLRVEFKPSRLEDMGSVKVYGYTYKVDSKTANIEMNDLSSGEERQVMLRLKVTAPKSGAADLGTLNLRYLNQVDGKEQEVAVPLKLEVASDENVIKQLEAERQEELKEVRDEALLRQADEMHLAAMEELKKGNVQAARAYLDQPAQSLAAAAPENVAIANKLEQMRIDTENLDRAVQDAQLRSQMSKSSKASAYMSYQGKKAGMLLQKGDSGYMVERLQKALAEQGFYKGQADGRFGPEVEAAVKAFQQSKKLDADGIAGAATLNALGMK